MPTFVAPSFKADPEHGDDYAAYNKPGAIMAWLTVRPPELTVPHAACMDQAGRQSAS
jgi:hypothetical protein